MVFKGLFSLENCRIKKNADSKILAADSEQEFSEPAQNLRSAENEKRICGVSSQIQALPKTVFKEPKNNIAFFFFFTIWMVV